MKKLILFIALALPFSVYAQITWTQQSVNFFRLVAVNPTFDSNGDITNFPIFLNNGSKSYLTGSNSDQYIIFNLPQKKYDLITDTQASVTVDDITVTYAQLAKLIVAASLQINPLPKTIAANTTTIVGGSVSTTSNGNLIQGTGTPIGP